MSMMKSSPPTHVAQTRSKLGGMSLPTLSLEGKEHLRDIITDYILHHLQQ
jgi:hypothetical protein